MQFIVLVLIVALFVIIMTGLHCRTLNPMS